MFEIFRMDDTKFEFIATVATKTKAIKYLQKKFGRIWWYIDKSDIFCEINNNLYVIYKV